jgi:hypothetical protein
VWEFEFETPGEAMDIIFVMMRGIRPLQEELKNDKDSLECLKAWDKAVGALAYANPDKGEVFEKRIEYSRGDKDVSPHEEL